MALGFAQLYIAFAWAGRPAPSAARPEAVPATDRGEEMVLEGLSAVVRGYAEIIGPRAARGIAERTAAPVLERHRPELEGQPAWEAVVGVLQG
ncbi:MAG: hypothetical protein WC985_00935 [Thermoplasmata archaeon]